MVIKQWLIGMFIITLSSVCHAQTLSLESALNATPTVRSMGIGNAYTAVAEAEGAIHFNPAGLATPGFSYSMQYLDYDNLNHKTFYGNFFYVTSLGFSNIQLKDWNNNRLAISTFGYGHQSQNGFSWGLNYKSVTGEIDGEHIDGWSSDFGVLATVFPSLKWGFVLKDFYQKGFDVPVTYATGLSTLVLNKALQLSTDVYLEDADTDQLLTRAGMEFMVADGLVLRSGISQDIYHAGANISLPIGQFDVAAKRGSEDSETYYSLGYQLGIGAVPYKYRKRESLFKPMAYAEFKVDSSLIVGQSNASFLEAIN